jgi:superfamily II DNA/RNA helicase
VTTLLSSSTFLGLGLPTLLSQVLADRGITSPTPIQAATLADAIAGRDVLGRGRTGSGKTYAFLLPMVTRLSAASRRPQPNRPRAVILAPTRELAIQIDTALQPLAAVAGLTSRTVFGGVGQQPQVAALRRGVDVLVACPGRLEDLVKQGHCRLDQVQITVLDEADHMADLGFLPGVTRLLSQTPKDGQRMFFSATLDSGVDGLVRKFLTRPAIHQADSAEAPVASMDHHVLHVSAGTRTEVLVDLAAAPGRTVIFTRTKSRAKTLTRQLNARGVRATELHGNLSQNARTRNMDAFHGGIASTLVATDIAARGIHVDDVGLVVHADPPVEHKAYLHRSGRTARAGAAGTVVTLMTADQVADVRDLTRKAGIKPTTTRVNASHPLLREVAPGERDGPGGVAFAETSSADQQGRGAARGGRPAQRGQKAPSGQSGAKGPRGKGGQGGQGGTRGQRGAAEPRAGAGAGRRSGGGGRGGSPKSGSASVYSTSTGGSSGGAAAFSSRPRAGSGRAR